MTWKVPSVRLKRWSWRLVRIAVGVYVGLALVLSLFQTQLIFPGAATQGYADAIVRPTGGAELVQLKAKTGYHSTEHLEVGDLCFLETIDLT